jgi:PII-like signaling protein
MLKTGPAKKVTVYVGEDVHHHGAPLYQAVLNYLFEHGVAGAIVTKGVAGFGAHHRMHTRRILEMTENLPIKIEFVEQSPKLDDVLPGLTQIVVHGLIEMHDTVVLAAPDVAEKGSL